MGSINVARKISNSQITGCLKIRHLKELPPKMLDLVQVKFDRIPKLIMALDAAIDEMNIGNLKASLRALGDRVCDTNNPQHRKDRDSFVLFAGPEAIVRLIFKIEPVVSSVASSTPAETRRRAVWNEALVCVYLCVCERKRASSVARDANHPRCCFICLALFILLRHILGYASRAIL